MTAVIIPFPVAPATSDPLVLRVWRMPRGPERDRLLRLLTAVEGLRPRHFRPPGVPAPKEPLVWVERPKPPKPRKPGP